MAPASLLTFLLAGLSQGKNSLKYHFVRQFWFGGAPREVASQCSRVAGSGFGITRLGSVVTFLKEKFLAEQLLP